MLNVRLARERRQKLFDCDPLKYHLPYTYREFLRDLEKPWWLEDLQKTSRCLG
jgi:hypothetical protein